MDRGIIHVVTIVKSFGVSHQHDTWFDFLYLSYFLVGFLVYFCKKIVPKVIYGSNYSTVFNKSTVNNQNKDNEMA